MAGPAKDRKLNKALGGVTKHSEGLGHWPLGGRMENGWQAGQGTDGDGWKMDGRLMGGWIGGWVGQGWEDG